MIIAIDGPAAAGKGELSKRLAEELNILVLDTGGIYRSITYAMLKEKIEYQNIDFKDEKNKEKIREFLNRLDIQITENNEFYLNGQNITEEIRNKDVTEHVSFVSSITEIRLYATDLMRKFAKENSVIMDGRDIGTYVFPNADVKIYLTADLESRVERRYRQNIAKGIKDTTYDDIKKNLMERDYNDINGKEIGSLKKADDAVVIDNTNLSREETLKKVLEIIESKNKK